MIDVTQDQLDWKKSIGHLECAVCGCIIYKGSEEVEIQEPFHGIVCKRCAALLSSNISVILTMPKDLPHSTTRLGVYRVDRENEKLLMMSLNLCRRRDSFFMCIGTTLSDAVKSLQDRSRFLDHEILSVGPNNLPENVVEEKEKVRYEKDELQSF